MSGCIKRQRWYECCVLHRNIEYAILIFSEYKEGNVIVVDCGRMFELLPNGYHVTYNLCTIYEGTNTKTSANEQGDRIAEYTRTTG